MQIQTVFKAGNSDVVSLPAEVKKKTGIKAGGRVVVDVAPDGHTILISKEGRGARMSSVTPEFIEILEGVNKRYGPALTKLAKV